jgi:hemoglobin
MKKQFTFLFALVCITGMIHAQSAPPETSTLFERLGGTSGVTAIVDDVIDAHMNNPAINARFLPYQEQPERFAKIRQHTIDFFPGYEWYKTEFLWPLLLNLSDLLLIGKL